MVDKTHPKKGEKKSRWGPIKGEGEGEKHESPRRRSSSGRQNVKDQNRTKRSKEPPAVDFD